MNIAFITPNFFIAPSGGIKLQALMWKQSLEKFGHNITLINSWDINKWEEYDLFIVFGYGGNLRSIIEALSKISSNIYLAPIIDTNYSTFAFQLACKYLKCKCLRLHSIYNDLYEIRNLIKLYFVRSDYEKQYLIKGLNISPKKIAIVPLSYRIKVPEQLPFKENFCFHVSLLTNPGKNVKRLIDAAKKYNFHLILAGTLRNAEEETTLYNWIGNHNNIEYIGYLSEKKLIEFYNRAKVFALPSTYEGVGMVALEAAACGCNIVLTDKGGPKEYYNKNVYLVDPFDVDSIGQNIIKAMNDNDSQPSLMRYIQSNYNFNECARKLNSSIKL